MYELSVSSFYLFIYLPFYSFSVKHFARMLPGCALILINHIYDYKQRTFQGNLSGAILPLIKSHSFNEILSEKMISCERF